MEAQAAGRIHPFKVCVTAEAVVNPGRASTDFNAVLGILGSFCPQGSRPWDRECQLGLCDVYSHGGILSVAGLIVYASGNWQQPSTVSAKTWFFLVLSGAATGASWISYYRALKLGDAGRVAPVDKLSVVFVAVFAVLFLGERLTLPNWLAVIPIACGAVLVAYRA
jgi:uncharacterized membrane protein